MKNEALAIAVKAYEGGWYGLAKAINKLKKGNLIWAHYSTTTSFLNDLADNLNLNLRTVHRFIKAYDLINELTPEVTAYDESDDRHISKELSPHSLEQLHQLKQVMPAELFATLKEDFFAGRLKRDDLRKEWLNFKSAISGKVRRRPVKGFDSSPTVDTKRVQKAVVVKQICDLFSQEYAESFKLITMTASQFAGLTLPAYDIICIIKASATALPEIHGICLVSDLKDTSLSDKMQLADSCDRFWLSLPTKSYDIKDKKIGLISYDADKLIFSWEGEKQPDNPNKYHTLRNLLMKCQP